MNNGFSTGYFSIERGTRQGDLLSAYILFCVLKYFSFKVTVQLKASSLITLR